MERTYKKYELQQLIYFWKRSRVREVLVWGLPAECPIWSKGNEAGWRAVPVNELLNVIATLKYPSLYARVPLTQGHHLLDVDKGGEVGLRGVDLAKWARETAHWDRAVINAKAAIKSPMLRSIKDCKPHPHLKRVK